MEQIVNLHVEQLTEGFYLATSEDIPGLIAQGRTLQETLEIARDVAKKLIEARSPRRADEPQALPVPGHTFFASAEWDSHTAEGTTLFRPTGFACSDNSVTQY